MSVNKMTNMSKYSDNASLIAQLLRLYSNLAMYGAITCSNMGYIIFLENWMCCNTSC